MTLLWVCLGGAIGTGARFLLSEWARGALGTAFPYGTLAVNVVGSLLIAFLMGTGVAAPPLSSTARLALTTGVMGGFTTFSAFTYETMACIERGAWSVASFNVVANVAGCLVAGFVGLAGARWLFAP